MDRDLGRLSVIALCLCCLGAQTGEAQVRTERISVTRIEASTFFGALLAGKEIARGINATGGHEQLIARLNHSGALGLRVGMHAELVGLEAGFLNIGSAVRVDNEFGVRFPSHGGRPVICSGDALLYPFRKAI